MYERSNLEITLTDISVSSTISTQPSLDNSFSLLSKNEKFLISIRGLCGEKIYMNLWSNVKYVLGSDSQVGNEHSDE